MAVITSLLITTVYGRRLIDYLRFKQVGETVRNLGLEGQMQKQGTPTMGGLIIIAGILSPTLLFARDSRRPCRFPEPGATACIIHSCGTME